MSLLNRLIIVSESTTATSDLIVDSSQSFMYSLLIKSISQQSQSSSNVIQTGEMLSKNCESLSTIAKNNQFLVQLNLMMSQAQSAAASGTVSSSSSSNSLSATTASQSSTQLNEVNWFHLLVNLAKHKSAHILDCMLFSLFRKVAQLTPRLFGSLLGTDFCVEQMHEIIASKLRGVAVNAPGRGQVISSVCEFLCALVEFQPGYFQSLVAIKSSTESSSSPVGTILVDESRSVLKFLFDLLSELKNHKVNFFHFILFYF